MHHIVLPIIYVFMIVAAVATEFILSVFDIFSTEMVVSECISSLSGLLSALPAQQMINVTQTSFL